MAAMPKVLILIMNKEMEKMKFCFFIYTKLYADCDVALDGFLSSSIVFGYIFSFLDFSFRGIFFGERMEDKIETRFLRKVFW